MPIELPDAGLTEAPPQPPRAIVWLILFIVFMLVGVVSTLLTWPASEPTGTPWFWTRLIGLPALIWCMAFGLRLHYYDEETERLRAEQEARQEDREKGLRFAREPLAVLGLAVLSAHGRDGVAGKIAAGGSALGARTSRGGHNAVRHTALELTGEQDAQGRYRTCFKGLLDQIADTVAAIPPSVPLSVRLELPDDVNRESLLGIWQVCWDEKKLRTAKARLLASGKGLMVLDDWLDVRGGPLLEKFTLFVCAQLHEIPPQNSTEAAVALLLGWAPLADRRGMKPWAMLHRPVQTDGAELESAMSKVLLWGNATADLIDHLWQAALERKDKSSLLDSASVLSLGLSKADDLSGIHDIDIALGNPGVAAGWLAAALAIEHAAQVNVPQLIAWREGSLRLAIAQPMTPTGETEARV